MSTAKSDFGPTRLAALDPAYRVHELRDSANLSNAATAGAPFVVLCDVPTGATLATLHLYKIDVSRIAPPDPDSDNDVTVDPVRATEYPPELCTHATCGTAGTGQKRIVFSTLEAVMADKPFLLQIVVGTTYPYDVKAMSLHQFTS